MTDEQIIKALECFKSDECLGAECPYASIEGLCGKPMCEDVYDFIYRQKAEIERLQEVTTNTVNSSIRFGLDKEQEIRKAKSEAYKEFAKRLREKTRKYIELYGWCTGHATFENIDNTYKELTEGGNEDGMD